MTSTVTAAAGILSALFIFACSSTAVPTRTSHTAHNLLENGTFEEGMEPWYSLDKPNWSSFSIEEELLDHGRKNHFARTSAVTETPYRKLRISGAVQELTRTSHTQSTAPAHIPMTTASDSIAHPRCSYGYTSGVLRRLPCIHGHLHRFVKIEW